MITSLLVARRSHGSRFELCSLSDRTTASPLRRSRPRETMLRPSVVLRRNTISWELDAPMNFRTAVLERSTRRDTWEARVWTLLPAHAEWSS